MRCDDFYIMYELDRLGMCLPALSACPFVVSGVWMHPTSTSLDASTWIIDVCPQHSAMPAAHQHTPCVTQVHGEAPPPGSPPGEAVARPGRTRDRGPATSAPGPAAKRLAAGPHMPPVAQPAGQPQGPQPGAAHAVLAPQAPPLPHALAAAGAGLAPVRVPPAALPEWPGAALPVSTFCMTRHACAGLAGATRAAAGDLKMHLFMYAFNLSPVSHWGSCVRVPPCVSKP